jgi:hypothetical protein
LDIGLAEVIYASYRKAGKCPGAAVCNSDIVCFSWGLGIQAFVLSAKAIAKAIFVCPFSLY